MTSLSLRNPVTVPLPGLGLVVFAAGVAPHLESPT